MVSSVEDPIAGIWYVSGFWEQEGVDSRLMDLVPSIEIGRRVVESNYIGIKYTGLYLKATDHLIVC